MSSSDLDEKHEKELHEHHGLEVSTKEVDVAAELVAGEVIGTLDPAEALRIRRKIDRHILPLMCTLYLIQFMDKTTLGSSAILGIREATHLSTPEYNWLGTVFYLSYLLFEFPQNLCLQRFPVAKWLSINIFVWGVALACHAACTNFAGLLIVRLILGACEGCITTGFMIVTAMFYTRTEQTLRVGYWYLMNGTAQIVAGFISFGTLHIKTNSFEPWQWLMIITGLLTLTVAIMFWFFFPDSPTTAWFLTVPERKIAIQRIKENQTGVENKHFKKEQLIEALLDPKTWLFALFACLTNIPNSLSNQRQIIISSFGFTVLQTTLLSCVDGAISIITVWTGVTIAARLQNRTYVAVAYKLPVILSVFLINFLPWSDQIGLLISLWISGTGGTAFVLTLSWLTSVTAGHTKRVTVNAIMLSAYCIGNSVGPQMWLEKYKPRNHIPWLVVGICEAACIGLLLLIRFYLNRQNNKRDAEPTDMTYDDVYIERVDSNGVMEKARVDKEFLDLTDIQNRDFRYVL